MGRARFLTQADVIDLNNEVATKYNEMVSADEKLAEILTKMRSVVQVSVGEALATAEASAPEESAAEASSEEKSDTITVTKRTIKATDVVNIRSSDSVTADTLDKTTIGQEFKELERLDNGWSKVEYKNGVAYVKTEFFETVSEETEIIKVDNTEEAEKALNEMKIKDFKAYPNGDVQIFDDIDVSDLAVTFQKKKIKLLSINTTDEGVEDYYLRLIKSVDENAQEAK